MGRTRRDPLGRTPRHRCPLRSLGGRTLRRRRARARRHLWASRMSQRRIHLLMTADTLGGVWTYAIELIGALKPFGVDVTLATMGAPLSPAQARTAATLENLDVVEGRFA